MYKSFEDFIQSNKLRDYVVDDINIKDSEVIFVLESPYKDEVKKKYPVAGKTGQNMSRVLFQRDESLGALISNELSNKENNIEYDKKILKFGIVNISSIPLQKEAYNLENVSFLEKLFFLRDNITKDKKRIDSNYRLDREEKKNLIKIIIEVLKSKFQLDNKKVILCGNFSQAFYEKAFGKIKYQETLQLFHPVNWNKEDKRLKSMIDNFI